MAEITYLDAIRRALLEEPHLPGMTTKRPLPSLEVFEQRAGAGQHGLGQPRELRHRHPVGSRRPPRRELVQ